MTALALLWSLAPLLWQLQTSFRPAAALVAPGGGMSGSWTLENYQLVLAADPPFWRYLLSSALVGLLTTVICLAVAVPAAYALARQQGPLRLVVTGVLMATALFPTVLLFLPLLEAAQWLGLANNLAALALPYSALSLPLAVLLLRAAFADLPQELEEAARLEGLGFVRRLRHILLPLLRPALASTAILVFLFSWNEYPIALTWISRADLLTLPVAIARLSGSSVFSIPYGPFAAATVLGSLPLLLLVLIFQRSIVAGLTQGAIKG